MYMYIAFTTISFDVLSICVSIMFNVCVCICVYTYIYIYI